MMAYVDYGFYKTIYGVDAIPETDFNRLSWESCRKLDVATTGIDHVKKLKVAFPTDEDDAETVRRCACKLIDILYFIDQAEKTAQSAQGYVTREDGTVVNKQVASVSSGNESITYATGNSGSVTANLIGKALADKTVREQLYRDIITECLSGIEDANGVNLLYMGRYPYEL